MKCRYLRGVPWTMSSETLKSRSFVRKFSIKLLGGLFFPSTFDRSGGGGGGGGLVRPYKKLMGMSCWIGSHFQ